jgi:hypothetical protein
LRAVAEAGLDPPGPEYVDPDQRCERAGQRAAEAESAALHRGEELGVVARHPLEDVVPRHVDDDAAGGLGAHQIGRGPGREHGTAQVYPEQQVQLLPSGEPGPFAGEHVGAGIVDPGVHPTEGLLHGLDQDGELLRLRDVGSDDQRALTGRPDVGRDAVGAGLVPAIGEGHVGTGPRGSQRDGAADATRGPGHEDALAGQAEGRFPNRVVRCHGSA